MAYLSSADADMDHQKLHWFEKLQVQIATLAGLAVTYILLAPWLWMGDPQAPTVFVPFGAYAMLGRFAIIVWILAVVLAFVTIKTRPDGAVLSTLIAAGGISLHSQPIRVLFWMQDSSVNSATSIGSIYLQLALELLAMLAIVAVAVTIITTIRKIISRAKPSWVWSPPICLEPAQSVSQACKETSACVSANFSIKQKVIGAAGSLVLSLVLAMALIMLLMRTPYNWHSDAERGQVIFALLVGCMLAVLASEHLLPCQCCNVAWLMPILLGIILCILGSLTQVDGGGANNAWINVKSYASALPIDWATAGSGGAVIGHWISSRLREAKRFEDQQLSKA
jgi:hypothetical protein